MNYLEVIEAIKMVIRLQAPKDRGIPLSFFTERKDAILQVVIMMQPELTDADAITMNTCYETAVKEYKSVYQIEIDPSASLTNRGFTSWLTEERKRDLPDKYIKRFLTYYKNEGRSEKVISELSRSSESILSKLGDPQSRSSFYKKGLVVGSVQSGKTANFNAVVNRAVDAGYNLIIILSGIMEDLRSQTQLRLESDVIGEGVINVLTEQQGVKGVGKIVRFGVQGNSDVPQVFSITSHKSDFKKQVQDANFSLNNKNILVCKKNPSVLKNLLLWLSDYLADNSTQHDIPLLVIDDEADNASLNNLGHKGRQYASTINGQIRALLALFSRKTYLGYTATPFANVLQDRNEENETGWVIEYNRNGESAMKTFRQVDNIFPDDFIELLNPPSNYVGAKQIFLTRQEVVKIPLVEAVDDVAKFFPAKVIDESTGPRPATQAEIEGGIKGLRSPRRDDLFPVAIPPSMTEAIECFLLSIAVRFKRKTTMVGSKLYNPHHTMLIHVSRFTDWQNRTRDLVQKHVDSLTERVLTELPSSRGSVYAKLEMIWNRYYLSIISNIRAYLPEGYTDEFLEPVTFAEIKGLLPDAVKNLEIKAINNVTSDRLIYTVDAAGNGKKYIAIGGNCLSRGFTLEGLSVNYFVRDTNYADTLLQMGRWFGYRPGYLDCCKLFTTWDSIEKFDTTTLTIEELESEFKRMHRLEKTPEDFILRVRTDPAVLRITRPSILKNTEEVNWSYQDSLIQTTKFVMDHMKIEAAWTDFLKLTHKFAFTNYREFYISDMDINGLFEFLDAENSFYDFDAEFQQIKSFVRIANRQNKLKRWRIAIKSMGESKYKIPSEISNLPGDVSLTIRSAPSVSAQSNSHYRKELLDKGIFTGSGKSANIVTTGTDMSLWLDEDEISAVQQEFVAKKIQEMKEIKVPNPDEKARKLTKPERIYRERMSDEVGLLVIYLMDLRAVFPETDKELTKRKIETAVDVTVPLIGYALGFPPMAKNIGGVYVRGKYNIEEDEPAADEFSEDILFKEP